MEVAPTIHYAMGGVRVDAETGASTVPGLYAAGEVASGLHGANRLGGNSLSDLLVFGKRAGEAAAAAAKSHPNAAGARLDPGEIDQAITDLMAPLDRPRGRKPLQGTGGDPGRVMTAHAPINSSRRPRASGRGSRKDPRAWRTARVNAGPEAPPRWFFNPGWHTSQDLRSMLVNAEAPLAAVGGSKGRKAGRTQCAVRTFRRPKTS